MLRPCRCSYTRAASPTTPPVTRAASRRTTLLRKTNTSWSLLNITLIHFLSSTKARSCPPPGRHLDQGDDDGLDVALRFDGLETQFLRKVTWDFESEEKPNGAGDRGWLRSTGHGDPCGDLRRKHGGTAFRHRLERKPWLIVTPCRSCASPPTHLRNAWIIASFRDAV